MYKTKHTPGPWVIDQNAAFADTEIGHMVYAEGGDNFNGHLVCEIRHTYSDNQTDNARLIAAAPDLLEALEDAVEILKSFHAHPQAIEQCELAIKKAT